MLTETNRSCYTGPQKMFFTIFTFMHVRNGVTSKHQNLQNGVIFFTFWHIWNIQLCLHVNLYVFQDGCCDFSSKPLHIFMLKFYFIVSSYLLNSLHHENPTFYWSWFLLWEWLHIDNRSNMHIKYKFSKEHSKLITLQKK